MVNPHRFWSVLWAVVTGMFLGSMIAISVLQVPLWLQQGAVAGMFVLYVLVMVSGVLIPIPRSGQTRQVVRRVRFQRYPSQAQVEVLKNK